jgi:hypothetical protein
MVTGPTCNYSLSLKYTKVVYLVQGGRNEALGGALAAAQRAWSYSHPADDDDGTPAWQQQQQQQQFMTRSQAAGQAMLLPDPNAGRSMLGDFGDALSDITEDEDEMTQEEVRTCFTTSLYKLFDTVRACVLGPAVQCLHVVLAL